jgi:hypothetical protein
MVKVNLSIDGKTWNISEIVEVRNERAQTWR